MAKKKGVQLSAFSILFLIIIGLALLTWVFPQVDNASLATVVMAPFNGFKEAIDVCIFILLLGGFLGVVTKTGALDAGVGSLVKKLKGNETVLIVVLMVLFSIGGTTYGMAEETVAFYVLICSTMVAAGFDTTVGVATIMLGAGVGVLGSTVNPFAVGVALDGLKEKGIQYNSGTVILSDSATINNPNVALYTNNSNVTLENTGIIDAGNNTIGIYGYETENNGDIKVGNSGIGIYSKNGNVTLTGGKIKTGINEAVGVYTVGSGQNITNTGTGFEMADNSFGFVNVGSGNNITSNGGSATLSNNGVFIYSSDKANTINNSTNISSTGSIGKNTLLLSELSRIGFFFLYYISFFFPCYLRFLFLYDIRFFFPYYLRFLFLYYIGFLFLYFIYFLYLRHFRYVILIFPAYSI